MLALLGMLKNYILLVYTLFRKVSAFIGTLELHFCHEYFLSADFSLHACKKNNKKTTTFFSQVKLALVALIS